MSEGFSFPPPPPPPPKAAPEWNSEQAIPYGSQSRGGRGQGRGSGNDRRGRARDNNHRGGNYRGSGSHLGIGHGMRNLEQVSLSHRQPSFGQNPVSRLPPGAYVNPSFGHAGSSQSSFSATPPRTTAGHKRKLDALRGPPRQQSSKPGPPPAPSVPSFGAPVHGATSSAKNQHSSKPQQEAKSNVLGLTPSTGEVQYSSSEEDDDDDEGDKEVDEEAMYAELGTKLAFEHNGVPIALNSAADIAAWQADRKRNWPTSIRMAEKEVEKRKVGEERKRLLAAATILERPVINRSLDLRKKAQDPTQALVKPNKTTEDVEEGETKEPIPESELEKQRRLLAEQTAQVEELRKKIAQSEALVKKADEMREAVVAKSVDEQVSQNIVAKTQVIPTEEIDIALSKTENADSSMSEISSVVSSDSDSDDDGPPEQATSKPSHPNIEGQQRPLCRYFVASGRCRDSDGCQFRHELPERGSGQASACQEQAPKPAKAPKLPSLATADKKGIFERLMEQEQAEDDRLVLQVVRYLGKAGFFHAE